MKSQVPPISIYLSGASREIERVEHWVRALERTRLFEFSLRWWTNARQWSGREHEYTEHHLRSVASTEAHAIKVSRFTWVLWPEHFSSAAIELGIALADMHTDRRRVFVSGPGSRRSPFSFLATMRHDDDAVIFDAVCRIAREIRVLELARPRVELDD